MSVQKVPEWQRLCEDALSESDPKEILGRVIAAEAAIFHRLTGRVESIELEVIDTMLSNLRCLLANSFALRHGRCTNAQRSTRSGRAAV
jgi:hypothetical protein